MKLISLRSISMQHAIFVALIIIAGVIVYANSINGQFIWDDELLIKDNIYIKSWSNLWKVLTRDIGAGYGSEYGFYRPVLMFTLMVDYALWGLKVQGYHISTIIFHILATLSIYWFLMILYKNRLMAFIAAMLFVVHPVHAEDVSYITGRANSLLMLFMVCALIFYIRYLSTGRLRDYILLLSCALLALLSKENAVVIVPFMFLYHYVFQQKLRIKYLLPVIALTALYLILRITILAPLTYTAYMDTTLQRLPGFFIAIANYTRLLFMPFNLHSGYGRQVFTFNDLKVYLGLAIAVILLTYAFKKHRHDRVNTFSIFWFFIALIPVSNVIYPACEYMAERYLYVPSLGFCLILARYMCDVYSKKGYKLLAGIMIAAALIYYSSITISHNRYWREPILYYKQTLKYDSLSPLVHANLGKAYYDAGRTQEAIDAYNRSIALDSSYAEAYNNLAVIYYDIGDRDRAVSLYMTAIGKKRRYIAPYINLGNLYNDQGIYMKAIELYNIAIGIDPEYPASYKNLGNVYYNIGQYDKTIACLHKVIDLDPKDAGAYYNLGNVYYRLGRLYQAIVYYEKTVSIDPGNIDAYNNMGNAYYAMGQHQKAIQYLTRVTYIDPDNAKAYYNMGIAYYDLKMQQEAVDSFQKAVDADKDYAKAYFKLSVIYFSQGKYTQAVKYYKDADRLGLEMPEEFLDMLAPYIYQGQDKGV